MEIPFFKRKKQTEQPANTIKVNTSRIQSGLLFSLTKDKQAVKFPLQFSFQALRQQTNLEQLELLEELWSKGLLTEENGSYHIPYVDLYDEEMNRSLLGLPEEPTRLTLLLKNEGLIPNPTFRFVLEKSGQGWKHLERTSKRIGPLLLLPNGDEILMTEDQFAFELLVEHPPSFTNSNDIFRYVAEVLQKAKHLGIACSPYLAKQNYQFIDGMELDVSLDENRIMITPQYTSTDTISTEVLQQMSESASTYGQLRDGTKIFTHPMIQQEANEIKKIPPITKGNIPKFIHNPSGFLPNSAFIDLTLFGERVKQLGMRVYRAQPFVHANQTERGWFDIKSGFRAVDEEGTTNPDLSLDKTEQLIEKAREQGEDYIHWGDSWIQIPAEADAFLETRKIIEQEAQVVPANLPYVLEIFDNIHHLEYNEPILVAKQKRHDAKVDDPVPPKSFQGELKPFQMEGFTWMKGIHFYHLGGLLADDMGLGKTIQVISFLAFLAEQAKCFPALIIMPSTLIQNWKNELSKFAPSLCVNLYVHRGMERSNNISFIESRSIVITTYETVVRDQLLLAQIDWKICVCDEAQAIKNSTTARSKVIKALKADFRLALTGTPVENSLADLWSIIDYVQPGLLGSLKAFKEDFIKPFESNEKVIEKSLLEKIAYIYKRRTKQSELQEQLPAQKVEKLRVPLSSLQLHLYQGVIDRVQNKELNGLQAIRQIKSLCAHPALVDETYQDLPPSEVPKLQETLNIVEKIKTKQEKVLIFTEERKMQRILRGCILEQFGVHSLLMNGDSVIERRQEIIDSFSSISGFYVMILSPKTAGTGLTITSANHVIHYTRWWNPAVENQATDRVYRIGQEKNVTVYYPIVTGTNQQFTNGTVEEIVHRLLQEKQKLAQHIIVPSDKLNIEQELLDQFFTK